jgi:hypothetical protein
LVREGAIRVGEVWDVKCDGYTEHNGLPKFARIVRKRTDLRGTVTV